MVIGYHNSNDELYSLVRQYMTEYTVKTTSASHLMETSNKVTSSCNQQQVIYMPLEMTWYGYTLY